ncbi:hypothetical protein [Nocardia sp. NPDC046763]|uniref:hypothetical protein n=1 Tax=Nocardia sp. NPDC046763 TaxID=3155256 RepID=UPI0033D785C8
MVTHNDHLFTVGQIDPDDRVGYRHQRPQPGQPRVTVAITPGYTATVTHGTFSCSCDGTPSPTSASGGRSPRPGNRRTKRLSMPMSEHRVGSVFTGSDPLVVLNLRSPSTSAPQQGDDMRPLEIAWTDLLTDMAEINNTVRLWDVATGRK